MLHICSVNEQACSGAAIQLNLDHLDNWAVGMLLCMDARIARTHSGFKNVASTSLQSALNAFPRYSKSETCSHHITSPQYNDTTQVRSYTPH